MKVREAPFALRVVQRRGGKAVIVYRRRLASDAQENLAERLDRVAAVSPLAYTAGVRLLREAVRAAEGPKAQLRSGPFHALDADWGARVACYALVASGLKNAGGLGRAAENPYPLRALARRHAGRDPVVRRHLRPLGRCAAAHRLQHGRA